MKLTDTGMTAGSMAGRHGHEQEAAKIGSGWCFQPWRLGETPAPVRVGRGHSNGRAGVACCEREQGKDGQQLMAVDVGRGGGREDAC